MHVVRGDEHRVAGWRVQANRSCLKEKRKAKKSEMGWKATHVRDIGRTKHGHEKARNSVACGCGQRS